MQRPSRPGPMMPPMAPPEERILSDAILAALQGASQQPPMMPSMPPPSLPPAHQPMMPPPSTQQRSQPPTKPPSKPPPPLGPPPPPPQAQGAQPLHLAQSAQPPNLPPSFELQTHKLEQQFLRQQQLQGYPGRMPEQAMAHARAHPHVDMDPRALRYAEPSNAPLDFPLEAWLAFLGNPQQMNSHCTAR